MKNGYVHLMNGMLLKLLLAIPLGIAIHAFALTPSTVKAAPCEYCDDTTNLCELADYGGSRACVDSGDGQWCDDTQNPCPLN